MTSDSSVIINFYDSITTIFCFHHCLCCFPELCRLLRVVHTLLEVCVQLKSVCGKIYTLCERPVNSAIRKEFCSIINDLNLQSDLYFSLYWISRCERNMPTGIPLSLGKEMRERKKKEKNKGFFSWSSVKNYYFEVSSQRDFTSNLLFYCPDIFVWCLQSL